MQFHLEKKHMDFEIHELSGCDLPSDFWPPDDSPECGVPALVIKRISKASEVPEKHVKACLLYAKHCCYEVVGRLLKKHKSTIQGWVVMSSTRLHHWALKEIRFSKKKILHKNNKLDPFYEDDVIGSMDTVPIFEG